jgi:hypothetical protein
MSHTILPDVVGLMIPPDFPARSLPAESTTRMPSTKGLASRPQDLSSIAIPSSLRTLRSGSR